MFRKYYKEANNDIKPDEKFINSVIENAHKRKPPVRRQYIKYAASIAAAVVVVSAAVISMPVWKNVTDKDGGVIIEERVTQTAPPQSTHAQESPKADAFPENNPQADAAANPPVNNQKVSAESSPENTSKHSYNDYGSSNKVFSKSILPKSSDAYVQNNTVNTEQDMSADEAVGNTSDGGQEQESVKNNIMQEVGDSSDFEPPPERTMPPALENAEPPVYSTVGSAESAVFHDEPTLPTPSGYHCVSASWNGYTFASDDGAVIAVEISYGGEEDSEPYYSVEGDNIFATFTAYGMTVTVSAAGADMSTVEEIINSLR